MFGSMPGLVLTLRLKGLRGVGFGVRDYQVGCLGISVWQVLNSGFRGIVFRKLRV